MKISITSAVALAERHSARGNHDKAQQVYGLIAKHHAQHGNRTGFLAALVLAGSEGGR